MNRRAQQRHTVLAVFFLGSVSLLACSEDGDPGTPAGGLQLGQSGNGQGSSSSGNGGGGSDDQTDPGGGAGGTGGTNDPGGGGGTTSKGGSGGSGGSSTKGGSGGTSSKGGSGGGGGTSSKGGSGGSGGTSSKGGTGGSGGTGSGAFGGTGGTGAAPSYFDMADFFTTPEGQETVCSDCLRSSCASQVSACGNLADGGDCYTLAECIASTAKETDTTLDCAFQACGSANPTFLVNDFLSCLGNSCAEGCAATPGFTSCPP